MENNYKNGDTFLDLFTEYLNECLDESKGLCDINLKVDVENENENDGLFFLIKEFLDMFSFSSLLLCSHLYLISLIVYIITFVIGGC